MEFKIITDLKLYLKEEYKLTEDLLIEADICPGGMDGDLTVNCFKFARSLKKNPMEVADIVAEYFVNHADVEKSEKIKAFVNLTVKAGALHNDILSSDLLNANLAESKTQKILIEYSAPNTNKPQHLGHVRNNVLGMSLASLLAKVGHDVRPVNLVNDRGIHICKSMIAYQRFGNGTTPESENIKGDHFVGKYYVIYNGELKKQLSELRTEQPELEKEKDDDLFLKTEIGAATQKMLQDWENEDCEVRKLWEMMNEWVFAGFAETYDRLGVKFDKTFLESNTYLLGKDIIEEGLKNEIFYKREDGATMVDLGKKLGEKVVLRSDGTSVYITQDIGTTIEKQKEYSPDKQIWVVGDEQIFHFKQLFGTLDKMGYDWAKELHHLAYGMVNLPTGRMKSREGTVVDADDLFNEMVGLAKAATLDRCGENVPADIDERCEIIGLGALKFMLLKFNPKTTISFDPQASLKFEGDTGPYVQYACARIYSMERKGKEQNIDFESNQDWDLLDTKFEKNLSIRAAQYAQTLQIAAGKLDCSVLITYLLDLAKDFSRFYRECPVLSADNAELKAARLALSCKVRDILVDGLKTLTIDVLKSM